MELRRSGISPTQIPLKVRVEQLHRLRHLEIVIERSKSRSSIRRCFLLLMLGVCVFLWGFSYKLSLYNVQEPTPHRVPEAKLLSKNEDSRAVDGVRQVLSLGKLRQPTMFFRLVAVTIGMAGVCARRWYFKETNFSELKPRIATYIPSLCFRPPPIQSEL